VIIGLSGGIDSALVLAVAVDALGAERVRAVMMPSAYTADISCIDARDMARRLGVRYDEIPIAPMFDAFLPASRKSSPAWTKTRPKRTSRRAFAARC
jgi:NAD+ synthase (glutamine-hydrolysing)